MVALPPVAARIEDVYPVIVPHQDRHGGLSLHPLRLCSSFRRWAIPTEEDFFNSPNKGGWGVRGKKEWESRFPRPSIRPLRAYSG